MAIFSAIYLAILLRHNNDWERPAHAKRPARQICLTSSMKQRHEVTKFEVLRSTSVHDTKMISFH